MISLTPAPVNKPIKFELRAKTYFYYSFFLKKTGMYRIPDSYFTIKSTNQIYNKAKKKKSVRDP
jgi:hypothetical protein